MLQNTNRQGTGWPLGPEPLVIGRGEGCDIRVLDSMMSRRHLRVWLEDGKVRFEDLGSSNATLVNGKPSDGGTLGPGDTIAVGTTLFLVSEQDGAAPAPGQGVLVTPITLAVNQGIYMRAAGETRSQAATPRTVRELHDLFHLGRMLGEVESVRELTALLERTLRAEFEPCALWIAWRYGRDVAPTYEMLEDGPDEKPPADLLLEAMRTREGALKPAVHHGDCGRAPQTVMAVPLVHADEAVGGFLMCGRVSGRMHTEDDLHYALGIASITAPHVRAVRYAEQLRRDNLALRNRAGTGVKMLGESPQIQNARELINRAADSALPVLILGETGTGKEIAARMLHDASRRSGGPYVVVNCAAIPENLFESEYFGHERGAFTGAANRRMGRFEEAHGGTLFLDEVGDLSADNQARILRAIETNTFHRVGGDKLIHVDVRVVAATNKTLQAPDFRADLLHRLNTLIIQLPPLRERPEDIPQLARHFLDLGGPHGRGHVTGISPEALALLQRQPWPGNVRELKAVINRAVLLARSDTLTPEDLQLMEGRVASDDGGAAPGDGPVDIQSLPPLAEIERRHILRVVGACGGNISAAARVLGINRVTLYKRLAEYGNMPGRDILDSQ